jgi:hypothetical protein
MLDNTMCQPYLAHPPVDMIVMSLSSLRNVSIHYAGPSFS